MTMITSGIQTPNLVYYQQPTDFMAQANISYQP